MDALVCRNQSFEVVRPWATWLQEYIGQTGVCVSVRPSALHRSHDGIVLRFQSGDDVMFSRYELRECQDANGAPLVAQE